MAQAARKISTKAKSGSIRSKQKIAKSKTVRKKKTTKKTTAKSRVSNSKAVVTALVTEEFSEEVENTNRARRS